jgi:hypothetical protein
MIIYTFHHFVFVGVDIAVRVDVVQCAGSLDQFLDYDAFVGCGYSWSQSLREPKIKNNGKLRKLVYSWKAHLQ